MTKTEFLDLLRYYFRYADAAALEEILADYEAHFAEGAERGLTEAEIAAELGSPRAIYEMYVNEGMVEETFEETVPEPAPEKPSTAEKIAGGAEKMAETATAKAKETWNAAQMQIPEAQALLLKILLAACMGVGFFIIVTTCLILYLISGTFAPIGGLPPLPPLSPVTLAGVGGTGIFAGLALCFTGAEIRKFVNRRTTALGKGA